MNRRAALALGSASLLPNRARAAAPFPVIEIAPGNFVRHGVHEEATAGNADGIANIGFIIGRDSVAVIDPGGSRPDGERLRASIRRQTDRPISHVILTHLHPDHVFGAPAFAEDRPLFIGHARMAESLQQRGDFYRAGLAEVLGPEAAGTYPTPGLLVQDAATIDLGARTLRLQAHPTAHTDNDLSVLDDATGTLWTGDLLFVDRVPALDGSILGWLAQTRNLPAAARAVPGHGPVAVPWPGAAAAQERYLGAIVLGVRATIARGGDIEDAVATVGQEERGNWLLFDDYHGRNVTSAFKELEWD